ncbi:hypothetical protein AP053_gp153 [Ostreococcus mediterraneus virus 1]|uniref:hypothetical protein n=1 Tax=Ostreococcus mediterraneus virus 1 TaxID=1663210 RepID=UPI0006D041E3|nr:hypothetical protein AP053_gp153 [Ostreococcus mediterraneus virus 1]ALI95264.1 hypothetical protein OmV1_153c [Ostreococcus mediterraneus virus 1]
MLKERARMKASSMVSSGLRMVMCFTRDRFHANRRTNVAMRMLRMKRRSSVSISDLVSDLATRSMTCILLNNYIFFYTDYK